MCSFVNRCCQHIWTQNGFCCNAFCNDSTLTHPLCSSCLSCWFVLGGFAVYLFYLAALFLVQVHNLMVFRPWSAFLFLRVLLLPVAVCSFLLELVPGGDWDEKVFHPSKTCLGDWPVRLRGDWSMYILGRKDAVWSQYAIMVTICATFCCFFFVTTF